MIEVENMKFVRDFYCIYRKERVASRLLEEFVSFIKDKTG